jgi:hypothetical protein
MAVPAARASRFACSSRARYWLVRRVELNGQVERPGGLDEAAGLEVGAPLLVEGAGLGELLLDLAAHVVLDVAPHAAGGGDGGRGGDGPPGAP